MPDHYDIVIIGGGLVGASLAVALADSPLRIAVIESHPFDSAIQPSYDERTVALTYSARQIFTGMGIWSDIAAAGAEPILDIHVSNQGHFGMTHLSHRDAGTDALGFVVPTRVIGRALQLRIEAAGNIDLLSPASADSLRVEGDKCRVQVTESTQAHELSSRLMVLADGGRSALSQQFHRSRVDYDQQALLSIVSTDKPHNGRAYERFTTEGPLALLPHSNQRYAVVWTCGPKNLDQRIACNDRDFIAALQRSFGDRAGNFSQPSPRKSYPLNRSQVQSPVRDRTVVIGNAAHMVHPVAGQGFNLGLRDVASLAEAVYRGMLEGMDIGSVPLLEKYAAERKRDTFMVRQFTHGLIALFSNHRKPVELLRNIVLCGFELLSPGRKFVLKRTMGLAGQQSTLALGLPLSILNNPLPPSQPESIKNQ